MSWLIPTQKPMLTGTVHTVADFDSYKERRRAYHRAWYIANRRGKYKQKYTPEQKAKRNEQMKARYYRNLDQARAAARARYWKHRERYREAARLRDRAKRAVAKGVAMSWLIPTSAPPLTGTVRTIRNLTDTPDPQRKRRDTKEQRHRQYLRAKARRAKK